MARSSSSSSRASARGRGAGAARGLLEREQELAAIGRVVQAGADGRGDFALLDAPPGMGKSALCAAAEELAREREMAVLSAAAAPLDRELPFGVARKLFDRLLARAAQAERAALLDGAASLAAPLFAHAGTDAARREEAPKSAHAGAAAGQKESAHAGAAAGRRESAHAGAAAGQAEEASLAYGLYWLAVGCSERAPLLVVLDDIHWADSPSLRFLAYLAQRIDGLPIALLAAARSREPGADAQLLGHLRVIAGERRVLSPKPLSDQAIAQVVRNSGFERADDAFCAACAQATRGGPFLLVELLRRLRAEGLTATPQAAARAASLTPDIVLGSALERLAMLPPAASGLARAAAVLGEDANLRRAAALAGLSAEEAALAADSLEAAQIASVGEHARFEHPLMRDAVYDAVPSAERALLHARAAHMLDEEGEEPDRIAAHLLHATHGGESWAVERLVRAAGRASERGAHGTAVQLLRRALAEPPPAARRAEVLLELGRAQAAARDPHARSTLEQAAERLEQPLLKARALAALGQQLFAGGDLSAAARAFEHGMEQLGEESEDTLARELEARYVTAATGTSSVSTEDRARLDRLIAERPETELPAERSVLAAVALRGALTGEPAERVRELALRALADDPAPNAPPPSPGALAAREPSASTALAARESSASTAPDVAPPDHMGLIAACISLIYADELGGCLDALDRAVRAAQRTGSAAAFGTASSLRAWPLYFTGRLHEAIADCERALEASGEGAYEPFGATLTLLTHAQIDVGDLEGAARTVAGAEARAKAGQGGEYVIPHAARGRLKLVQGDPAGALEDLSTQGRLLEQLGYAKYPIPWRPTAALAALALGHGEQARQLAAEELELAEQTGAARGIGVSLRACGLVAGGEQGVAMLERAVQVLETSPAALERARALVDLGALLRRAGQRAKAREPLRSGRELAHRFGAMPLLEQATAELQATGARPRRIMRSGIEALTPSERRIAAMAAEGMSNPQIAQALFVTRKTVEFHLGNAYGKLGIGSRGDLPAALREPA